MNRMQQIAKLQMSISQLEAKLGATTLIAIDGPSGAGKTTLAFELHQQIENSELIHMDDLYAGWDDALSDELYDRISTQIITPFSQRSRCRYQKYNWNSKQFEEWVEFPPPQYLILEGVGSAGIQNRQWISLCIYLEVSDSVGLERVRHRDGAEIAAHIPAWQELQHAHFKKHKTDKYADVFLSV